MHNLGSGIWKDSIPEELSKRLKLFSHTPLLETIPDWELEASMIEASIYQGLLQNHDLQVLNRPTVERGGYLAIIPFTWTSCNNRLRTNASASYLWNLMTLSLFTYQVDEFMEAVAGPAFEGELTGLRRIIDETVSQMQRQDNAPDARGDSVSMENQLAKATRFILDQITIRRASHHDRTTLVQELRIFFHAHATQVEDSSRLRVDVIAGRNGYNSFCSSFYRWLHTTSSDHIAAPFCFYYMTCLLGADLTTKASQDCFLTATEKYLAAETCHHLACMCRMYNDAGSWSRDHDEGNLNCIHFPDFATKNGGHAAKKAALLRIAQNERRRWQRSANELRDEMVCTAADPTSARFAARKMCLISMFCDVTDLYGQLYVLRDLSSAIQIEARNGS